MGGGGKFEVLKRGSIGWRNGRSLSHVKNWVIYTTCFQCKILAMRSCRFFYSVPGLFPTQTLAWFLQLVLVLLLPLALLGLI